MTSSAVEKGNNPLISVVMAVYNGQDYVADAVESILAQTFTNFEFIIIDDGSTDQSKEILKQYASQDSRIRLYSQENMGLTRSLNRGIQYAQTEYIARQDADDISVLDRLEKQWAYLQLHTECFLLGTAYEDVDEDNQLIGFQSIPLLEEDEDLRREIANFNPFCHSSMIFRRDSKKISCNYDESFYCSQDYELWIRFLKAHQAAILPEALVRKRTLGKMISVQKERLQRWCALRAKLRGIRLVRNPFRFAYGVFVDLLVIGLPKSFTSFLKFILNNCVKR